MAHARRFSSQRGSVRRQTTWGQGPGSGSTPGSPQTISATGQTLLTIGSGIQLEGITLVRTRGEFTAFLTSVDALGSGFHGAIGMCIVSENAFNAGVTAVPHPIADVSWDGWIWFQ